MVLWVFGYGSLIWKPGFDFDEKVLGFIKDFRRVFDLACIDHRGTPEHPARTLTLEPKEGAVCWGIAYCVRGGIEKERATMQYLEKRESEYDKKALVKFYKVTKSLLAASCTRKIITCGRIRSVTNKNSSPRSKNVPCSVLSVKLDERTVRCPHIIIAPCTEEGESLKPYVTNVLIFISTPDKISNRYYLGPAPLEEMARQIATANGPCGNNRDYLFYLEKAMLQIGHEDEYVTELANEVRRVLGVLKDNKTFEPHFAVKLWLSLMNTVRLLQKRLFWIRDNNQANSPSLPS